MDDDMNFREMYLDEQYREVMCEANSNAVLGDGWRDSRKELPKKDVLVLICTNDFFWSIIYHDGNKWICDVDDVIDDIRFWRYLPDPPSFA